jgi:hypothetical protein
MLYVAAVAVYVVWGAALFAYELAHMNGRTTKIVLVSALVLFTIGPPVSLVIALARLPWLIGWACGWFAARWSEGYEQGTQY